MKIPIQTLKVSSLGTHNLLGLAKSKNARILIALLQRYMAILKFIHKRGLFWECKLYKPRGVYDEAKRFQESLTMAYHRFHGLQVRIARIFNTYGPRMRVNDGRVIPAFIGQLVRGENLTVFGDGSQTRSFCYVDDLIEGIYRLLFSDYSYPVNLGNPDEIAVLDFAKEILNLSKINQKIDFLPLPEGDPKRRQPDISLAKKILNWSPKN